jgi:hypothetical protein
MTRLAIALLVLALAAPPAALAQTQDPFGPLPQAPPAVTPTPEPPENPAAQDDEPGRTTLYLIAGALMTAFVFIGWWISRDARRSAPKGERDRAHRLRDEGPHKHKRQAKAKARAKGRAQKAARKAGRRR